MSWSVLGGIFIMLLGLGVAWFGFLLFRARPRQVNLALARFYLIGWAMVGLGFVCFGVTVLRHVKGSYVSLPASAPLIDQAIWVLSVVCFFGGFALSYALAMLQVIREKRAHRGNAGEP